MEPELSLISGTLAELSAKTLTRLGSGDALLDGVARRSSAACNAALRFSSSDGVPLIVLLLLLLPVLLLLALLLVRRGLLFEEL